MSITCTLSLVLVLFIFNHHAASVDIIENDENLPRAASDPSFATAIVNTQILTILYYHGAQVYIYSALSNENENKLTPQKWLFYYVPIMAPTQDSNDSWIWLVNNEIRLKLMLGNQNVEELARKAIIDKYDLSITQYSKYWTVAPLIIDSLMAYIVDGATLPVAGVHPYRVVHPNSLILTFRFQCSENGTARQIIEKIKNGDYEIELAFYFAGFRQISTNLISITSDQLKNVLSKTIADGANANAQYIHRNQASKFVGNYVTNVKKMIYMENTNTNLSLLTNGLEEQFISLLQQGMDASKQTTIDAALFDQVWSSSDLNPDRLTSELSKLFTYNDTETKRHNYTNTYFDLNKQNLQASSSSDSSSGGGSVSIFGIGVGGSGSSSSSSSNTLQDILMQTNHDIYSLTDIQRFLKQQQSEFQWTGEKFIPKSFNVYKLVDLTDRLQVAIISKQLIADKRNGALVRQVSAASTPIIYANKPSTFLTGTVQIFAGATTPPLPWLLCDGAAVSRVEYQRLFSVIGETYGSGDGRTTFNLPDFRGRFPLGVDELQIRVRNANKSGISGGYDAHQLSVEHLPPHTHGKGSLTVVRSGNHTHSYTDPGHDHGGRTGDGPFSWNGGFGLVGGGISQDRVPHSHSIAKDITRIVINEAGTHSHEIEGETATVGTGN
ncbi:unnamed protein product, partial [Rotaria sp. Silwood1]